MIYLVYLITSVFVLTQLGLLLSYWKNRKKLNSTLVFPNSSHTLPKVSLIFTAKDEEKDLPSALASLEQIDYPMLEIIAVNDRSLDATGAILSNWQSRHQFKFLSIEQLPEGWLGKTHALHKASEIATGEWLLFTDADVHFEARSLKKAIHWIQTQGLDFLSLAPHINSPSFLTQTTLEFFNFFFVLLMKPWMSGEKKGKAIGVGAFNLVRADIYRKFGGHQVIRLSLDDDMLLAHNTKLAGGKIESLNGTREIEIVFYRSLAEMMRGFEKNVFQAFEFSLMKAVLLIAFTYLVFISPFVLSFYSVWFASLFLVQIATYMAVNRQFNYSAWGALLLPLTLHIYIWAMLRSCLFAKLRKVVTWRGLDIEIHDLKEFQLVQKKTNQLKPPTHL